MRAEDPRIVAPSVLLRGALFNASAATKVRSCDENQQVVTINGVSIARTGPILCTYDRDVWLAIIDHLPIKNWPIPHFESPITTIQTNLTALGRRLGYKELKGNSRLAVINSLDHLKKVKISVSGSQKGKAYHFEGPLLHHLEINRGKLTVQLSEAILPLFQLNTTVLSADILKQLTQSPLASWLYAYIESHYQTIRIGVQRYRDATGTQTDNLYSFKSKLEQALELVKSLGVLEKWRIDEHNNVYLTKAGDRPAKGFKAEISEPGSEFDEETHYALETKISEAWPDHFEVKSLRAERRHLVALSKLDAGSAKGSRTKPIKESKPKKEKSGQ